MIANAAQPVDRYADRLMPRDENAERALLGSMLISGESMVEAAELVPPDAFASPKHAAVWCAFVRVSRAGSPADTTLIESELIAAGELEAVGGIAFLLELAESVPTAGNWRWYGKCVLAARRRRRLIEAAEIAKRAAYEGGDLDAAIDELAAELGSLQAVTRPRPERVGKILPRVLDEIFDGETAGVATGLREVDVIMSRMRPGQQIIVGGQTSMGKSSFATTVALKVAESGAPVFYVSCEMSKEELTKRLISARSGVAVSRMDHPGKRDAEAIAAATNEIDSLPLDLHFVPGVKLPQLCADVKAWAGKNSGGLLVVDYLQLVRDPGHRIREAEVAAVSRGLKALAGEAGVIVLAASQLSRDVDRRESRLPTLSDLRESGAIEQDADVVLLLYREDAVKWKDPDYVLNGEAKVLVAKQRNGATGLALLRWDPERMLFLSGGGVRCSAPARVELGEIPV